MSWADDGKGAGPAQVLRVAAAAGMMRVPACGGIGKTMRVDKDTGLLDAAVHIPSPNQDERPGDAEPELIVVHSISLPPGEYGGPHIAELFTNRLDPSGHPYFATIADLRVSAHLLIRRDGRMEQFVPFHRRAWHAGASCYQGREACNDFSIGIELEGTDEGDYETAQYETLVDVVEALCRAYPGLSPARLAGHSHISPERKTDPGPGFDWDRLGAMLGDLYGV
jgi:AmpD protein